MTRKKKIIRIKKLTSGQKKLIWAPSKLNAGMGWYPDHGAEIKQDPRFYEEGGSRKN